jgi:hypothetical protein
MATPTAKDRSFVNSTWMAIYNLVSALLRWFAHDQNLVNVGQDICADGALS